MPQGQIKPWRESVSCLEHWYLLLTHPQAQGPPSIPDINTASLSTQIGSVMGNQLSDGPEGPVEKTRQAVCLCVG